MKLNKDEFANKWIASWNSHSLDSILNHYSDDVEVTSPMIKVALGVDSGTLKGKEKVKGYWKAALEKVPDLKFELIDIAQGINSIALYYKSIMNKMAIEVMFFNNEGLVEKVIVHYK